MRRTRLLALAAGAVLATGVLGAASPAYADATPAVTCSAAAWSPTTVYVGGDTATYDNHQWTAKWWTQGEVPGAAEWGPWTDNGACDGGTPIVPGAPTGLTAGTVTGTTVALSWTAPSGTVQGYHVYRDGTAVATVTGTSTTVTGLAADTAYGFTVAAYNAAGESPRSAPLSVTTTSGGSNPGTGELPKHVLTGYWQDFYNGARALRLSDVPTTYDLVAVAFADADPSKPGAVTFGVDSGLSSQLGGYTAADFTADVTAVHDRGQKVVLSVGGQNGTISVADSTAAANFAGSITTLMRQYGFDGVDIDLENGVNATYMSQALHQIASAGGTGTIITMAPQTIDMQSTGMEYFTLALAAKDVLTIDNMQYYNSGTMNGCDGGVYAQGTENFLTALACIQLQGGLDPSQVGLGLPASGSAAGGGYQSPGAVNDALDCLASGTHCGSFTPPSHWPVRGAMTWSINWDASNGYAFANTVAPHLDTLP
ncbi:MAG TPA: glycosyl hydrolase family 18 protein [Actinocatenispora sp.]